MGFGRAPGVGGKVGNAFPGIPLYRSLGNYGGPGRREAVAEQGTYVRCEHRVAGWGLVHRYRQAEGARPQAAVLQQWDPLGRGWESGARQGRG